MTNVPTVAPFGTWKSPVSTRMVTDGVIRLEDLWLDGPDLYWLEGRPHENGRRVLVRQSSDDPPQDMMARDWDIGSRVHEYGGGAATVVQGVVYFSDDRDQRLYRLSPGREPEPITVVKDDVRYGDLAWDPERSRLVAVQETHGPDGSITNAIVAIPVSGPNRSPVVLASGHDFYMAPRISPNGRHLAFLSWDYPEMPWSGAALFVASLSGAGAADDPIMVCGGPDESAAQPLWSSDNQLYFLSDRNGWWNIWTFRSSRVVPITTLHADFGDASWTFGQAAYGFCSSDEIFATYSMGGQAKFVRIDVRSREMTHISCPFTTLAHVRVSAARVAMIAGSDRAPRSVVFYDLESRRYHLQTRENDIVLNDDDISLPQPVEFPNEDGQIAYGFYYPPKNREYLPPEGERPPLVLEIHGGPTDRCYPEFRLDIQFWTTRGFAVVQVNHGGSTGYGRAYRDRINGRWGIVDIGDIVSASEFLARYGKADPRRLVIRGVRAGGYTALMALATRDLFRAASTYCGVSDLKALRNSLPKFESHYLDILVGPYDETLYRDRSPIHHVDTIRSPLLAFHGLEDRIVNPEQTQRMVESLAARGHEVIAQLIPGEGHELSHPATIERILDAELAFFARVLNVRLPDRNQGIPVENW